MSSDTEPQQVAVALMDENEKPSSEKVEQISKLRRPRKNYFTEDCMVRYGVTALIIILVIVGIILMIIYVRKYNQNCSHTKGASCRGALWYFNK
jgi:predicted nucleic acid-binding Zn ribbon protein